MSGSASHAGSPEPQRHLPGVALAPARLPTATGAGAGVVQARIQKDAVIPVQDRYGLRSK